MKIKTAGKYSRQCTNHRDHHRHHHYYRRIVKIAVSLRQVLPELNNHAIITSLSGRTQLGMHKELFKIASEISDKLTEEST